MKNDIAETTRNPFGVMDVPGPNDEEVERFAADAPQAPGAAPPRLLEGDWSSRWNGGAAGTQWKEGEARIALRDHRFYALFDWDGGAQRGLIEARRDGAARLVGRNVNLGKPEITRPWVGTVVDDRRIDGYWPQGQLDFRR